MVGPPHWPHWILVGKIQCGSLAFRQQITGVISLLRARDLKSWPGRNIAGLHRRDQDYILRLHVNVYYGG